MKLQMLGAHAATLYRRFLSSASCRSRFASLGMVLRANLAAPLLRDTKSLSGACIFVVAFYITEWYEMAVRVFKDPEFASWADDEGLADASLCAAAAEIENGLVNGNLGGFLVKKRVGAPGRGKSGGYRTIVAHRQGDRLFFLHGFAKNEKDNISKKEKKALHKLGDQYMAYSNAEISELVRKQLVIEVACHEQNS